MRPLRVNQDVYRASFIEPMLSRAGPKRPEGAEWAYEVKFDEYRADGIRTGGWCSSGRAIAENFNARFPAIAAALDALPDGTVIDGEVVAYDAEGQPSFSVLQNQLGENPRPHFFAFDLMFLRVRT